MRGYWLEFCQVALAHLLAVASPGPDFAVVVRQSLTHGRRAGIWTSIGVGSAISLHIAYSLLGLGVLLKNSPAWFELVRFAGAAYLAWLGVHSLRSRPVSETPPKETFAVTGSTPAASRSFVRGFLTNALNPKATLFFLSLFALVVDAHTPLTIRIFYGGWMAFATMAWFSLVAMAFTRPEIQRWFQSRAHWVDRALGIVLIGFAALLIFTSVQTPMLR
jgi:RhtB (resistance to homoserine/threonine) family protein